MLDSSGRYAGNDALVDVDVEPDRLAFALEAGSTVGRGWQASRQRWDTPYLRRWALLSLRRWHEQWIREARFAREVRGDRRRAAEMLNRCAERRREYWRKTR